MTDNEAKQRRYDEYVNDLTTDIMVERRYTDVCKAELIVLSDKAEQAVAAKKECQSNLQASESELTKSLRHYFDTVSQGWENWQPDLIEQGEIKESMADDQWKTLPARNHFDLTDSQWDKLLTQCDDPVMSVGRLAEIVAGLESGQTNIKGLGQAVVEKIKDQFESFWAKVRS